VWQREPSPQRRHDRLRFRLATALRSDDRPNGIGELAVLRRPRPLKHRTLFVRRALTGEKSLDQGKAWVYWISRVVMHTRA